MSEFANVLLRRHGDLVRGACASCGEPMLSHFAGTAVSAENPNGFVGCPRVAKDRALVETVADVLVTVLAAREGVSAHLQQLTPDLQRDYRAAAEQALRQLGAIAGDVRQS